MSFLAIFTSVKSSYGLCPSHYSIFFPPMFQESLLADPDIDDLKEDLEEKDHEFAEKQRTLEQYEREQTMFILSCKEIRKNFLKISQEIKGKVAELKKNREEREANQSEMATMEAFKELLEKEVEALENELEGASYFSTRNISSKIQQQQKQLQKVEEMTSRRETGIHDLSEKLKSAEGALRSMKVQVLQLKEEWFQEIAQILSKSQQIHQLKRVMGQLNRRVVGKARQIDQTLQQRMAAKSKPQRPVFQVGMIMCV